MDKEVTNNMQNAKNKSYQCYKYCFVPHCDSTTVKYPSKIFVAVPRKEVILKKWIKLTRRDPSTSLKSHFYCCEDHFKLDEDLENYTRVKLNPGANVRLKKGVFPRFFKCQEDRKRAFPGNLSAGAEKLKKLKLSHYLESDVHEDNSKNTVDLSNSANDDIISLPSENYSVLDDCDKNMSEPHKRENHNKNVGVQVNRRPFFRSIGITCNIPDKKSSSEKPVCSPIQQIVRPATLLKERNASNSSMSSFSSENSKELMSDNEYNSPKTDESSTDSSYERPYAKDLIMQSRLSRIRIRPKTYIGVDKSALFVLEVIAKEANLKFIDVCLALEKIKNDMSFLMLGDEYGISSACANTIYKKTIPILAYYLRSFLFWPSARTIERALPLPFRANYHNVQAIIDCFEIQIQKPSNTLHQALTWSEYKKCNTVKYLISSTPDGSINFISKGFGGRTSDMNIIEESKFLEVLPSNCSVMADRGFKHIEPLLKLRNCILVRPPSVSGKEKPSKSEVLATKRIASLRIHIERVIGRLRHFALLKPHATIPIQSMPLLDEVVVIAAALINTQKPVIAQRDN